VVLRPFSEALQRQFRTTLDTPGAPEVIDDSVPVMAVAVIATVTTASESSFVKVTDGTDTALVSGGGQLLVQNCFPAPSAEQTVIMKSSGLGAQSLASTGTTVYTVTSGKVLYITSLTLRNVGAATDVVIRDGGAAGTIIWGSYTENATAIGAQVWAFPTPLKVSTDVTFDVSTTNNHNWSFSGWEE